MTNARIGKIKNTARCCASSIVFAFAELRTVKAIPPLFYYYSIFRNFFQWFFASANKNTTTVLLDSGLRLYGFVDIDSAFELELDIVFSFDFYAVD